HGRIAGQAWVHGQSFRHLLREERAACGAELDRGRPGSHVRQSWMTPLGSWLRITPGSTVASAGDGGGPMFSGEKLYGIERHDFQRGRHNASLRDRDGARSIAYEGIDFTPFVILSFWRSRLEGFTRP